MFSIVRQIHLYTAFAIAAFLLMFFLTGAIIIMEKVFPRPNFENQSETIAVDSLKSVTESIQVIHKKYSIRGEETVEDGGNGKMTYSYFKPGYRAIISFNKRRDSAQVQIRHGNFKVVVNDFHRFHDRKGSWVYVAWDIFYDLSCIALLVFAFSGIYLWWKLERQKTAGIICLLISTGITVFTILYLIAIS